MADEGLQRATGGRWLSRRARVLGAVAINVALVLGMYVVVWFGMDTLRGIRGFVGAEGLWSKHQKDAVHQLEQFARKGDPENLKEFHGHLQRIKDLQRSRIQLDSDQPDERVAARGFIDLGLNPDDVPAVMRMYRRFKGFERVRAVIDIWVRGDAQVAKLLNVGEEFQRAARGAGDTPRLASLLDRAHALDSSLRVLEDRFSLQLSEVAGWAQRVIYWLLGLVSILVCGLLVWLGRASARVVVQAERAAENLAEENWLKSSRAGVAEAMRGAVDEQQLGAAVIRFLTPCLDAQVGALFIAGDDDRFRLRASYAYAVRKQLAQDIGPGEGLVGQAILERQPILLTEVPDDYVYIGSGLGGARPRNILVYPVVHERVEAVIEIATLGELDKRALALLDLVQRDVAMAVIAARAARVNQALLEQTTASEVRLREANEELQSQQDRLRESNDRLEVQTHELQQSQAELEAQQQQLEQVNAALEIEREEVDARNKALEATRAELEQKARELEQSSRYKSEFLANMSHELRTPLNSINVLSGLLAENRGGTLSDKQVEYARTIGESGVQLLTLINEILDLSKIEAGRLELLFEEVQLPDLLSAVERQFRPLASDKGIDFVLSVADDAPSMIRTDGQRLSQVIRNLASNALKFTEQGEVRLEARRPRAAELARAGLPRGVDDALVVQVSDTGIGIPRDQQESVFEAFKQADGATDRKFGGTGLGLSISRKLMSRMGGALLLDSEPGKGSRFTIVMPARLEVAPDAPHREPSAHRDAPTPTERPVHPAAEDAARGSAPTPSEASQAGDDGQGRRVHAAAAIADDRDQIAPGDRVLLIVEDDPAFASTLLELSRERGYRGVVAVDAESGTALATRLLPTAILLDLNLPGMDGMAMMRLLKDDLNTRHIPVHVVSGRERMLETLRAGAVGYLRKPVSLSQLNTAFERIEDLVARPVRRLVVAEAEASSREAIVELLRGADVAIETAEDGDRALALVRARRVDCLVIGESLRDMTGAELLRRIRRGDENPDTPVVVVSSAGRSTDELRLLHRYADRVLGEDCARERLLDETALFLHRIEASLPEEKRRLLSSMHDRDAILRGRKVLLVDDDIRNVFALSSVLEEEDVTVVTAKNGVEALARLEEHPDVDLVLMDIMMPEMDGYEAMRRIRLLPQHRSLPIIALTAKAMREDRGRCIEAGASDYLNKPVEAPTLLSMMRVWLYR